MITTDHGNCNLGLNGMGGAYSFSSPLFGNLKQIRGSFGEMVKKLIKSPVRLGENTSEPQPVSLPPGTVIPPAPLPNAPPGDAAVVPPKGGIQTVEVKEVGSFNPKPYTRDKLTVGETGYFTANIKSPREVKVGDTISVDQKMAEVTAKHTRYSSMEIALTGDSLGWTADGVRLPAMRRCSEIFASMFEAPKGGIAAQRRALRRKGSVLDDKLRFLASLPRIRAQVSGDVVRHAAGGHRAPIAGGEQGSQRPGPEGGTELDERAQRRMDRPGSRCAADHALP